jgi:hypothetical protein
MEKLGSNWTDLYEIIHLSIFRKTVLKIQVSLKWGKNNVRVLYMKTSAHFLSYLFQFFLEWEMFQTNVVGENENQQFVFNLFLSEINRAVY